MRTKIRLYNAIVLSTLLYGSETWPMMVANRKRLQAAHHKWLRRILHSIMARQNIKQNYKREDGTRRYRKHHQKEKIEVDGACFSYG